MSRRKREHGGTRPDSSGSTVPSELRNSVTSKPRKHWIVSAIIGLALFTTTALALKYLDDDAKRQRLRVSSPHVSKGATSWLDTINPFATAPLPNPTPQLSKEYIYASSGGGGGRLLAVEDANALAAPPADLAVWRPSSGYFYVLGGPGSAQTFYQWGTCATPGTTNCDVPVPGDFDGDGKTDFSVFRPSTGVWWVTKSSDSTFYSYQFGLGTDLPAQADYDGDGRTDIAVWRPFDGTWYIVQSSTGATQYATFGTNGDKPSPADYDGDGRADIAVYRESDKAFYSVNSSNNQYLSSNFANYLTPGTSSTPVSGDYDGDGRADYAIRNGNNWIVRNSSSPTTPPVIIPWEQSTDKAVQNDYDGDGKVDIATWRDSNGNWYIRKSASNGQLRQEAWGMAGDIPVPAFFRR